MSYLKFYILGIFLYFDALGIFPPGFEKEILKAIEYWLLLMIRVGIEIIKILQYCSGLLVKFTAHRIWRLQIDVSYKPFDFLPAHVTTHVIGTLINLKGWLSVAKEISKT